jgi:hypothetical protein
VGWRGLKFTTRINACSVCAVLGMGVWATSSPLHPWVWDGIDLRNGTGFAATHPVMLNLREGR